MPPSNTAPVQPNFYLDETFRQLPTPSPNLGNFADQLSVFGQTAAPKPEHFNLGNFAQKLDPNAGGSKWGPVAENAARAAGTALKTAGAAMAQGPQGRRGPKQEARAVPQRKFSLSDYLAALSSDPGRARL